MGHLIRDKMYVSLRWRVVLSASGRCRMFHHKPLRKAEDVKFKAYFSFFTSLSAVEAHLFGVKFNGLYGTVIRVAIRDFSCNLTKRCQIGFKIDTRDRFATI